MAIAASYISTASFSVASDLTSKFVAGLRVCADCGTDGLRVGSVLSATYSAATNLTTVTLDGGGLTANLAKVAHGYVVPASLPRATTGLFGAVRLATEAEAAEGTDQTTAVTPVAVRQAARQAVLSWCRDSLGKFPGVIPPSLNLFCGDATTDTAPTGTFVRSTTGTRLGRAGLIETVAAGCVRREWGAGGELKGWLLERVGTNLLPFSEQVDNAAWAKSGASVAPDVALSPSGNVSADKIQEDTATGQHFVSTPACSMSSSGFLTFSCFAKRKERSVIQAYIVDSTGGVSESSTYFDLQAGAVISGTGKIIALPNGWYRLSVRATVAVGACYGRLLLHNGDSTTYVGDGVSGVYVWGAQLEAAAAPSSYIPTASASVARAGDVWTIPLDYSWYRTTEGTAFVAGLAGRSLGVIQVLAQYDDGSYGNRIRLMRDESRTFHCGVITAGIEVANLNLGVLADDAAFRVAISWSSAGVSASLNGGACVTATAVTLPSGLTTHRIGSDLAGGSQWGGHVLHDVYFPVALSDADEVAITLL